jgi:integrase
MKAIVRIAGAPPKQVRPFRSRWLRRFIRRAREHHLLNNPTVLSRIALLSVGFYAALRRSEIAALNVGDIKFGVALTGVVKVDFVRVIIRKSKTDPGGYGQSVVLPATGRDCCPVFWLRRHLARRPAIPSAPLFISDCGRRILPATVAFIVKDTVLAFAPRHAPSAYSGHSLRRGGLTALSMAGAHEVLVQRVARHKDPRSTAKYIEPPFSALLAAYLNA